MQKVVMQQNEDRMYECSKILSSETKPILMHLVANVNNDRDSEIDQMIARAGEIKSKTHIFIIEKLE